MVMICFILGVWFLYGVQKEFLYFEMISYIEANRVLGSVFFSLLMCAATVAAPITVLPLVPLVSPILGPFTTMISAYIGWVLGASIAFGLARVYGQPMVYKFVSKHHIDSLSKYFDGETGFLTIVLLRIIIPVDALSYALGLFTKVTFRIYLFATMIGVFWFSFVFAYAGTFIARGNYVHLAMVSVASVAILYISWRHIKK